MRVKQGETRDVGGERNLITRMSDTRGKEREKRKRNEPEEEEKRGGGGKEGRKRDVRKGNREKEKK